MNTIEVQSLPGMHWNAEREEEKCPDFAAPPLQSSLCQGLPLARPSLNPGNYSSLKCKQSREWVQEQTGSDPFTTLRMGGQKDREPLCLLSHGPVCSSPPAGSLIWGSERSQFLKQCGLEQIQFLQLRQPSCCSWI